MDLERAIEIAVKAHLGQKDKAGRPYILHPLRVMMALEGETERVVAVLHDVVEDSPEWSLEKLRAAGFSREVLAAVDSVTRRRGEDYMAYVKRAGENPAGRRVKTADLRDNLDSSRVLPSTGQNLERAERYRAALEYLLKDRGAADGEEKAG